MSKKKFNLQTKRKIPKQRTSPWIRWPIRIVFLPFVLLDLQLQRIVKFFIRSPYKQRGRCKKCGKCCNYILLPWPNYFDKFTWFAWIFVWWNMEINGFYFLSFDAIDGREPDERSRVMGCRYLKEDGTCGNYFLRPSICRKWPNIENFGRPCILPRCGFKAILRRDSEA